MFTPATAHSIAHQAVDPIAYSLSGVAVVGHCHLTNRHAGCLARIDGARQTLHMRVLESAHADGTITYSVLDVRVDRTPKPDPAP